MVPESKPGFVRTLVGSTAAVVVVGSAVEVANVVGSALEVVIRIVEVAESEATSPVEPETVSVSVSLVAISIMAVLVSDTAVDPVKKVVDVSVSSAIVEDETAGADVDSAEVVDKVTEAEEEGLHGDAQASWHIASI